MHRPITARKEDTYLPKEKLNSFPKAECKCFQLGLVIDGGGYPTDRQQPDSQIKEVIPSATSAECHIPTKHGKKLPGNGKTLRHR
jgi:hypothetical protein